jgi:hypothetical protein
MVAGVFVVALALVLGACDLGAQERSVATVDAEQLRSQALELRERGEVGEAIEVAARAAELAPHDARSWAVLGCLHSLAGHRDEARASLARTDEPLPSGGAPRCPAP